MDDQPQLLCEITDGVARLTLNRPKRRNALSLSLLQDLQQELTRLGENPDVRVIVLGGNGPAFCAGHDLSEMTGREEADYRELFSTCSAVMLQLRQLPQPVIARVHGMATAAGCQLVAACDLAVASEAAQFATPGVRIGLFCTTPMVPLVRAVPDKVAMEMLMTGQPLNAERAREVGLVNRVVREESLDASIDEFCQAICSASPMTVRVGKQAFHRQLPLSEQDAYNDAVDVMTENAIQADAQEGMSAFLEKRKPTWTDR